MQQARRCLRDLTLRISKSSPYSEVTELAFQNVYLKRNLDRKEPAKTFTSRTKARINALRT